MRRWGILVLAGVAAAQVTPPRLVSKTEPEYPEEARKAGVNATVVVRLNVGTDGVPRDVSVVRPAGFGLDEKATEAVRGWRFEPALKNGTPVVVMANSEVNFRLLDPNHEGQRDSLIFTLPAGAERPVLTGGRFPENPPGAPNAHVRISLTVGADGVPRDIIVMDANPPEWGDEAAAQVKNWRFGAGAHAADVKGVLTIAMGASVPPPQPRAASAPIVPILPSEPTEPSLAAPVPISPAEGAVLSDLPRHTVCKWQPSPGAVSYLLEWDFDSGAKWNSELHGAGTGILVKGTEGAFDFVGAQPGRWRVWPVNGAGVRGTPSEWRSFRYTR